jgi:hypothetical protein
MTGGPWLDRGRGLWAATPMCGLGAHRHDSKRVLQNGVQGKALGKARPSFGFAIAYTDKHMD